MKCLVTGGAGFIGSFLCDRLLETGHEVVCIDNLVTGHKKNIAHLLSQPKFEFIEHDVTLPLPEAISASVIFHFASPASPPKYQKYAVETLLVNSIGTYYLLEKARVWQAKFIFASTSEVYGDPREHPQKETYWGHVNPNGPRSCYDEAKRVGESFVATYIRKYQLI
ncbi:MAG: NAD-dependent epimerase/dehydratase [Candidatus Gottesmanbacteria bacterium GW2011_GWB1_43_11]|uniref:UDP-glucuronate decarboxylase n=1 Tax=Candidatus Gottesmanbacteria bacterium GW2011_GWB1_43_11 TaxID=1618446 RepID=A0A0G1FKH5_9BACT|nr:MAG: NAD-dependent epimerase/dehydratase [Candidatus Gottesmanbacteria bacterium GW2011_GWB1_43_11]